MWELILKRYPKQSFEFQQMMFEKLAQTYWTIANDYVDAKLKEEEL
jgi:hypothetical protein